MSCEIKINGKTYSAIRKLAEQFSYAPDYITRLARERKIQAVNINRRWYAAADSLSAYITAQELEQQVRRKLLQSERQHELQARVVQRRHSVDGVLFVSLYALATGLGCVLFGGFVGLSLMHVQDVSLDAATAMTVQVDVATDESAPLTPIFTTPETVLIEADRQMLHPRHAASAWELIEYE